MLDQPNASLPRQRQLTESPKYRRESGERAPSRLRRAAGFRFYQDPGRPYPGDLCAGRTWDVLAWCGLLWSGGQEPGRQRDSADAAVRGGGGWRRCRLR